MREKLIELLGKYFDIGDSYAYNLARVKTAFEVGTMSLEDFEEFDEEAIADLADYLIENGATIPVKCGECDWYRKDGGICVNPKCGKSFYGCRVLEQHFCSYGEPKESEE